jgi:hypothetical protein
LLSTGARVMKSRVKWRFSAFVSVRDVTFLSSVLAVARAVAERTMARRARAAVTGRRTCC